MARSPAKRITGTLVFTIALLATMAFIFLLFAEAESIGDVPGVDQIPQAAIVTGVVLGVSILLMFLLLIIRSMDRRAEEVDEAEAFFVPEEEEEVDWPEEVAVDPAALAAAEEMLGQDEPLPSLEPEEDSPGIVVYDIFALPPMPRAWANPEDGTHPYYFPRSVDGGVYVNDYIPINDAGSRLKLRTLLAGPPDLPELPPASATPVATENDADAWEPPENEENPTPTVQVVEETPLRTVAPTRTPRPASNLFFEQMEKRFGGRRTTSTTTVTTTTKSVTAATTPVEETTPRPQAFYDYPGASHAVGSLEGVGPTYEEKLAAAGVKTTARLAYEDAADLARRTDIPERRIRQWQAMAELSKVSGIGPQFAEALARAGVGGIEELKKRTAQTLADQVNQYLEGLESDLVSTAITARRVEGWQAKAKELRRVRQRVPEE